MIVRGGGRSYGDSSLATTVLSSRFLDSFLEIDPTNGVIRCGAGVTMESLLRVVIPHGFFVPVLPGTKYVSVGGAIAADIHGKNHHRDGSFCDHIERFSLLLASGEILECGAEKNSNAFHATCGGMGLTGVILEATLKLEKVPSVSIKRQSTAVANLEECMELIEDNENSKHSVAWVDCLAQGEELGRSVLHLAEYSEVGSQDFKTRMGPSVPFSSPAFLLNKYTTRLFNNSLYSLRKRSISTKIVNYDAYFFPLDNIRNWNRLYGRKGFIQYQLVLPSDSARSGLKEVLKLVSDSGRGSFISVLKKFGEANQNLLSFPTAGYTLTLDFKQEASVFPLLQKLDEIVLAHNGKLYLAKDSRMSEDVFKASYDSWENFLEIKNELDPQCRFASLQSNRLGLT
ncbi:MAG: FAD-binding protein [Pseudomonadales bacterium]|nr:FAD-binding protein [Pseudomonadales bacterium]